MKVTLAYSMIEIEDAPAWLDAVGKYKYKSRKTPEEMRNEKALRKQLGKSTKVIPYKTEERSVMERDEKGRLYFLPGLWPRVQKKLEEHGEVYTVVDNRDPDKKPPIDFEAIKGIEFREGQDKALALIATADCGIIETTVGWGKSFLISVLCKAFPTLRIVVCTSSLSVVNTLYEYLMKQIPREVGIIGGGKDTAKGKRVIISTLKSLTKIPKDEPDLICCDECHDVGDNDAGHTIMQFYFARKFGFSATPVRNDGTGLAMEAIFGPTILQMSYEASVQAGMVTPMKYTMLPCTWCSDFLKRGQDLPEIVVKRFSYWANVARNKAIARLVSEVWNTTDAQVLVMCATLEHAIQLSQLMPWMVVAHYGNVDEETLRRHLKPDKFPNLDFSKYKMNTKDLERIRMAFGKGTLRGVISTYVFKQGVNVVHLQLLIRADGATSKIASIQIPGRLSRLDEGKEYAYLVDFDDSFTPWAKRRSDSRDKLYQEQGWTKITREELLDDLRTKPGDEPDNAAGLVEARETGCSGAGAEAE